MAPSFYVGYMEEPYLPVELKYDWRKLQFAPFKLPGRFMPAQKQSEHDAITLRARDVPLPRCNVTLGSYIDEERLKESWRLIHNITSLYPGSDQSGGIFLYPRQTMLLPYLVQRQIALKAPNYYEPFRVCETGKSSQTALETLNVSHDTTLFHTHATLKMAKNSQHSKR